MAAARVGGIGGTRPRLVVLRALNLGDILTGIPSLRALRRHFPDHHLTFAGPAAFAPLLRREGLVDDVYDTHELAPLDPRLSGPDVAVDLHGRGPGSQPLLLALTPRRLIAFSHPGIPATSGLPEWRAGEHEVRRWTRLLDESGIPADPAELVITPPTRPTALAGRDVTIVHPGAAAPSRRWPAARYAAVVRAEAGRGRHVVVTGSGAERDLAGEVIRLSGAAGVVNLVGSTDLDGLIGLVATAGRLVSGDTGVAHVAFATGTPSVTLYGPVPPSEWGPPPGAARHRALWAGRRGDPHGPVLDPGLASIGVDDVLAELDELERAPGRPATTADGRPGTGRPTTARSAHDLQEVGR